MSISISVSIFGCIWLILIFAAFFVSDIRFILSLTLISMVLQCNNIFTIGSMGMGVQVCTVFAAFCRLLFLPKERRMDKYKSLIFFLSLFLIYIVVNSCVIHKQIAENWVKVTIIAIYILFAVVLYAKRMPENLDEKWIESAIDSITIFLLAVGVLQYLAIAGISSLRPFLTTFIFNDVQNSNVIFHGKPTYLAMYSTFMEPSYFASCLVGLFSLIIMREKATAKNVILLCAIGLAILLSRSSTGYAGLAIVFAIQVVKFYGKKRNVRVLLPVVFFAVVLVALLNYDLLDKVLFSKSETGSYAVRTRLNERAFDNFLLSPWYGIGFGQSRASSLFYTIVAECGIIGLVIYGSIFLKEFQILFSKRKSSNLQGTVFAVIAIWICQIIACPDINFSPFWMALFVQIISLNVERKKQ